MVQIYTAQFRYSGEDRLDITYKTQSQLGQCFAPTSFLVQGYKKNNISQQEYYKQYTNLMWQSYCSWYPFWQQLLNFNNITLVCYCNSNSFCHRFILTYCCLIPLGVVYMGERQI